MRYFPHTDDDIREMLAVVGAESVDELFASVPEDCRFDKGAPALPDALDEWALRRRLEEMAARAGGDWRVFLGAGSQAHHIPALVPQLAGRSEFATAYTPYQPEMSQGTLQGIFEFQTLISRLTGLAVTNASMYDGSTAMAEAALMACRVTRRRLVAVSALVHPHWREVLATYLADGEIEVAVLPAGKDGRTDLSGLDGIGEPAVLLIQSPNFLGVIEELAPAAEKIHALGGLLAAGFSEPFAYGLIKSPGESGADIAFGEGQGLGLSQSFGGPGLGLLSARAEYVRQIPGRLVGETLDKEGKRGFVLTLSTREQHIRRGKAVSNICSNAGHAALTAAVFMAAIGGDGFREMARVNRDLAEYLKAGLVARGFKPLSDVPTFNEFTVIAPEGFAERHHTLREEHILAGMPLAEWYPEFGNAWLFGVTEVSGKEGIDDLLNRIA